MAHCKPLQITISKGEQHVSKAFSDLQACVAEFNSKYSRPGIPPLEPSTLVDVTDKANSYPNTNSAGVYAILNEAGVCPTETMR